MHTRQAKAHSSNTAEVNATETPQAAVSAAAVTRLPAWANAWGDQPPAALISPVAELQAKHLLSQPEDPFERQADHIVNHVMDMAASSPSVLAAPSDHPGASPLVAASLSHVPPIIQRAPLDDNTASTPTESTPTPAPTTPEAAPETASPALIVEDSAEHLAPGQMKKSDFLAQLRPAVCATAEEALKGTIWSAAGCPWIDHWFGYYSNRDSQQIERALRRYAPETARVGSASDYIPIICERVRHAIAVWSTTGKITEVPEGVPTDLSGGPSGESAGETASGTSAGEASSSATAVSFKGLEGGARGASIPQAIQGQLSSGQSLNGGVRSSMETAFGVDFSHVRVHTDTKAAELSESLNARAFTVGRDVAFGPGEYRPGTPIGDALIAHELAHVVQQAGASSSPEPLQKGGAEHNALEEDADISAVGAVVSLWVGAKGIFGNITQNALPNLRSGLRLQRCTKSLTDEQKDEKKRRIQSLIGNPEENEKEILQIIQDLGDNANDVLKITVPFGLKDNSDFESGVRMLAASEAGQRILRAASNALAKGDLILRNKAETINRILIVRQSPTKTKISDEQQQAIDRINIAIQADSRASQYTSATSPLRLPVTIYQSGLEMSGGVYYDPSMPHDKSVGGTAGETDAKAWTIGANRPQYPLIYIRLGPLALSYTDEYIRSAMWHEFQHYKRYLEYRKPEAEKSAEVKALEEEDAKAKRKAKPNAELEATSIQLSDDFDRLSDAEVISVLRYLADFMSDPDAKEPFIGMAINRIKDNLSGNRTKQNRLLLLIRKLSRTEQSNLSPLKDAIKNDLAPLPGRGKSRP